MSACSQPQQQQAVKKAGNSTPTEITITKEQAATGNIQTAEILITKINRTAKLNGVVDVPPQNMVSITCPLGGYIRRLNLLPGQEVRKGESLGIIEDPSFIQLQQDYLMGKSKLEYLEKEYERQKELSATDATSKKNFQMVSSDYNSEKINLKALEEKLALIGINASQLTTEKISRQVPVLSPIHGFVSKVTLNTGRYVNPTDVLAELVDPEDIHVMLTVFEKDISHIRIGQNVRISILDQPENTYGARVLMVPKTLDENRSGLVHCHFEKYFPELLPGMFVSAEIELGEKELPAVPEEAVLLHQGKHYILVETSPLHFKLTEVEIGEKERGLVSLLNIDQDIAGMKVANKGAFSLMGMLLKNENE
jgi:membrane fusion protein, heavy metal efflux system